MRIVERRLLVKIQNRTPNALGGITHLLRATSKCLNDESDKLKECEKILKMQSIQLTSALELLKNLIRFLDIPIKTCDGFLSALITPIINWNEYCWEEITSPSLEILNYSGPLRKNKNSTLDEHPTITTNEIDIQRYKKQFGSLVERICRLVITKNDNKNDGEEFNENEDEFEDDEKIETSEWMNDDAFGVDHKRV